MKAKVSNMYNPNSYKKVASQFIINMGRYVIFQSYNSIIAKIDHKTGKTYLDKYYWDYSHTTGKYRNIFLGETKKETERKIKEGIYILIDLNK